MNPQEKFWKVASIVGILLVVFLAVISIKGLKEIGYVGKSDQIVNMISVNGKGEAVAVPDIATFSFSVDETAKTVYEAQTKATAKTNSALKVVRDAKIADKDIKTLYYSVNPHYEYEDRICPAAVSSQTPVYCKPGKNVLTGYDVRQTIQVKVRDLNKAGVLFASIGALGITVDNLNFTIDDKEAVRDEARAKAIENAQIKAKELAKQLGVTLVRVTSFYESGDQPGPYYGMGGGAMMKSDIASAPVAPEVPAGEQETIVNVSISYEIK